MYNILIVDDEPEIADLVSLYLQNENIKKVWVSIKNSICAKRRRCAENNGKKLF